MPFARGSKTVERGRRVMNREFMACNVGGLLDLLVPPRSVQDKRLIWSWFWWSYISSKISSSETPACWSVGALVTRAGISGIFVRPSNTSIAKTGSSGEFE